MASVSSRYSKRDKKKKRNRKTLKLWRERWALVFYVWGRAVLLVASTAQVVEVVVALIEGRHPILVIDPRAWLAGGAPADNGA